MNGVTLNSGRHEPGEARACPLPSAPASTFCGDKQQTIVYFIELWGNKRVTLVGEFFFVSYHDETESVPQNLPGFWTIRYLL
jgi:hypothetical protein